MALLPGSHMSVREVHVSTPRMPAPHLVPLDLLDLKAPPPHLHETWWWEEGGASHACFSLTWQPVPPGFRCKWVRRAYARAVDGSSWRCRVWFGEGIVTPLLVAVTGYLAKIT